MVTDQPTITPASQRLVRNDDFDIAVYEYGEPSNETVLLVHGWPDDNHLWDRVVPLLADRFHVVTYDTRGHGRSTRTDRTEDYRLERFASDFFAVADAVSPDRPVHVLAHDWGSVQVWEAVCEPQAAARVASFTSVSGPNLDHLGAWVRGELSRGKVWGPFTQLLSSLYTGLFMTPGVPRVVLKPLGTEKMWSRFVGLMNETSPANITLGPEFRRDFFDGMRIYRANIPRRLADPRERRTEVPVQLIIARRDVAVRPAGYDNEQDWAPTLFRREVGGGHWLPFSHPELLATATTEMIESLRTGEAVRGLRRAEVGRQQREFEDQLLVITGGGSGIGRETALAFARKGAEVVLSDINLDAAKETAELVAREGGTAHAYQLDVADEAAVAEHAAAVIAAHGVPDILINNAGVGQAGDFFDTPAAEFDRVLNINLHGVVNGCRAFGKAMAERGLGGHIVNLSSMAAYTPQRGFSAYSTSKSAVFMFSDCLRAELAGKGIGVHTICPGIVHTNIVATTRFSGVSAEEEAAKQQRYDKLYAARRYGPEKVAAQIVKAVEKGRAVVPVTPEAHLQYRFNRFAPAIARFFAARVKLT
ncbi:SDR family oxidoreductase [Nocardia otitidiscaviarum]|uniref:SDR family oxidoreductase n=1 Tax=Nocardia otitidiscaviarum TaxID=1823 RepID=A0A516NHS0_9NOCA|nr:SDR family oxidoreductase [Nocardia otitidiscaviarum]MCP9620084.1 SDR family oxidoreductase [Nocardia otitidiscaviarum]QDP78419.1 SDR family oxidoreductase [Nocardia otitidiscaviarum]